MARTATLTVEVDLGLNPASLRDQARLLTQLAEKIEEDQQWVPPGEFAFAEMVDPPECGCEECQPKPSKAKLKKLELERDEIGRRKYLLDVDRRRLMDRLDALTAEIEATRMALEQKANA